MTNQELLDRLALGQSPLTGCVYIGIPDAKGRMSKKSDFTSRLAAFFPRLFDTTRANPIYESIFVCMKCGYMGDWGEYNYCPPLR